MHCVTCIKPLRENLMNGAHPHSPRLPLEFSSFSYSASSIPYGAKVMSSHFTATLRASAFARTYLKHTSGAHCRARDKHRKIMVA